MQPIVWLRTHEVAADALLAAILTVVSTAFHIIDPDIDGESYRDPTWWTIPLVFASAIPIAWRRRQPIAVAVLVVAIQVTVLIANLSDTGLLAVIVALYSLSAYSSGRRRTQSAVGIAFVLAVVLVGGVITNELDISALISIAVTLVIAFVLGDNLRRRREAATALQDRLDRAERERELVAHQRVTAERARIARELHDVVAHSVSVMVIQAAAARRNLATSPDVAHEALANIETTGRHTMDELRGLLGVLRRTEQPSLESELSPQPTLRSVHALVESAGDLPVELAVSGNIDELPTGVDLTGYRIVQEALTNVRRHAGQATSIEVRIDRRDDQLDIEITDDGRGAAADEGEVGFGIVGMRERVEATGGTVKAGFRPGGGWQVRASLPIGRHADRSEAEQSEPVDTAQSNVLEARR